MSASFGDGRIIYNRAGGTGDSLYSYEYFLRDHLGSTRMVMNDEGTVVEAVDYEPYGTMKPVGSYTSAMAAREKFTGKEFDGEGAARGKLEFKMTLDFNPAQLDLDPSKYSAVGIYYTDYGTPPADAKSEAIPFTIDDANNTAVAWKEFTYTEAKEIKWVHVVLNYVNDSTLDVNCVITPINETVGLDTLLTMTGAADDTSDLSGTESKTFFTYTRNDGYAICGIGQYYFGARYFDPEVGVWTSRDAAGQFWNPYGYAGNPVLMVDEDGNFFWLIPAIGFAVGYIRHGSKTGDWGWNAVKSGVWTGAAFTGAVYAPGWTAGLLALNQGCQNVIMNNPSNFREAREQFFMGAAEGLLDFGNIRTLGFLNEPISYLSGSVRGYAYNRAHGISGADARLNISEARKMNSIFGSYLGQGSLVKAASDFMFDYTSGGGDRSDRYIYAKAKRLYAEGGFSNKNQQYLDFIHKYGIKEDRIQMESWDQKKQGRWNPQIGHGASGSFFSHDLWHDAFESYGEPYEAFNQQDYSDDLGLLHWWRNYF